MPRDQCFAAANWVSRPPREGGLGTRAGRGSGPAKGASGRGPGAGEGPGDPAAVWSREGMGDPIWGE